MKTEMNKQMIKKIFSEMFNGRNFSDMDKIISPEYVNHGMPNAKKGPAGLKEVLQQFLDGFPDMKINVEHMVAEDNMVATRGYWTGTNTGKFMGMQGTGKKVRCEFIDLWKIENGMCVENWVQMDIVGVMQQAGMMPQMA